MALLRLTRSVTGGAYLSRVRQFYDAIDCKRNGPFTAAP